MASTVSMLYDIRNLDIPDSLRSWRVTQEDIDSALALMSRECASLKEVETVRSGDTVKCVALDNHEKYAGRSILLYPGRSLRGAEKAEQDVIGLAPGASFRTELGGVAIDSYHKSDEENRAALEACHGEPVTLKIEKILRTCDMEISDELAKAQNIEGVETLKQLIDWYIADYQPKKLKDVKTNLVQKYVLPALLEKSEFAIDKEEESDWAKRHGKYMYDLMTESGMDPHIPDEGFTFLTDEEALEKLTREQLPRYKEFVLTRYLAGLTGFSYSWEQFECEINAVWEEYAEEYQSKGYKKEDVMTDMVYENYEERAYANKTYEYLMEQAETLL
ncbi:MAG: hypothetical protein LUE20_01425 [Oscillospiraceae bacterium]|nr:hypothetical protein [Oscillospiraceae bacterium]